MRVLFGVRKGDPDWREELITEVESRIPEASAWARQHGFDRLRVADIDEDRPPDFAKTVN